MLIILLGDLTDQTKSNNNAMATIIYDRNFRDKFRGVFTGKSGNKRTYEALVAE